MFKACAVTDVGRRRKLNQDYVYISSEAVGNLDNLFIVADGMGGHNAGDYASRMAVETMIEAVRASKSLSPRKIFQEAFVIANKKIYEKSGEDVALEGMGTTLVAASFKEDAVTVANVGDSRFYIVDEKEMIQVTKDHSWVEEMVERGGLKREQAKHHPDKNIITRAVGTDLDLQIDYFEKRIKPNQIFLMCSDGLTNMLEDEEIHKILSEQGDIEKKAADLVAAANETGGADNISVVLIAWL